jgi:hypothetical protein
VNTGAESGKEVGEEGTLREGRSTEVKGVLK